MMATVQWKGLDRFMKKMENAAKAAKEGLVKFTGQVSAVAKQHAPVDTGRLRNSIQFGVERDVGKVWVNVEYAPFVEFGHKAEIRPVRAKALRFYLRGVGEVFAKYVIQGRSGKSATWEKVGDIIRKPFMKPAAEWAAKNLHKIFEEVRKALMG